MKRIEEQLQKNSFLIKRYTSQIETLQHINRGFVITALDNWEERREKLYGGAKWIRILSVLAKTKRRLK